MRCIDDVIAIEGLYNNSSMWRTYDWEKVTTIALFAELEGPVRTQRLSASRACSGTITVHLWMGSCVGCVLQTTRRQTAPAATICADVDCQGVPGAVIGSVCLCSVGHSRVLLLDPSTRRARALSSPADVRSAGDVAAVTTQRPEGYALLCKAHQHNVRVLPWSAAAFGQASPIAALYEAYRYKWKDTVPVYHNRSAVAANVAASVSFVVDSGFDGILLDAEGLSALTPAATAELRTDLVAWAGLLREGLARALPGSMLTWTTDNNATRANATVYDMAGLAQHLDLFLPMEYVLRNDSCGMVA